MPADFTGAMTALREIDTRVRGTVAPVAGIRAGERATQNGKSSLSADREPEPSPPVVLNLALVLQVLGDPIRLEIVKQLADGTELSCGNFELPVSKPTCSHHLRVLRECGLIETRTDGKARLNRLRREALEVHLPGLLAVILKATE